MNIYREYNEMEELNDRQLVKKGNLPHAIKAWGPS